MNSFFIGMLIESGARNISIVLEESLMIYTICPVTMVSDIVLIPCTYVISHHVCMQLCNLGTTSYLQPIDFNVWYTALMTQACSPPPMYDSQFYQECYELVHNMYGVDLHKDITHSTSLELYKFLVTSLST